MAAWPEPTDDTVDPALEVGQAGVPATMFVGLSLREYARRVLRPAKRSTPSSKSSNR